MMRQKTAPVPAMSKKTRQVTVTVGGHTAGFCNQPLVPSTVSLCLTSVVGGSSGKLLPSLLSKKPCFINYEQTRSFFPLIFFSQCKFILK